MNCSRRDLNLLLPLVAGAASAADGSAMPSKTYRFEDMPVKENGQNKSRAILQGKTHTGYAIDMHMTELAPGMMPHPPHQHEHEEMIMIQEGTMEVTIAGKTTTLSPGSAAYIASNDHHGWKNVGTTRARYFVMALGRNK